MKNYVKGNKVAGEVSEILDDHETRIDQIQVDLDLEKLWNKTLDEATLQEDVNGPINGINMENRYITAVTTRPAEGTDAVNVDHLNSEIDIVSGQVNTRIDSEVSDLNNTIDAVSGQSVIGDANVLSSANSYTDTEISIFTNQVLKTTSTVQFAAVGLINTVNEFSTDGTLADDSDDAVPTEKAVKTYVNTYSQPVNTDLTTIAAITNPTDGSILVGDGATWVEESGATARTSLGLGTTDSPTFATGTTISDANSAILNISAPAPDGVSKLVLSNSDQSWSLQNNAAETFSIRDLTASSPINIFTIAPGCAESSLSITSAGVALENGQRINEFSTDGTLADNSDTAVPTEKAVKTYHDAGAHIIIDDDLDTYIDVENGTDNDQIRGFIGGLQVFEMSNLGYQFSHSTAGAYFSATIPGDITLTSATGTAILGADGNVQVYSISGTLLVGAATSITLNTAQDNALLTNTPSAGGTGKIIVDKDWVNSLSTQGTIDADTSASGWPGGSLGAYTKTITHGLPITGRGINVVTTDTSTGERIWLSWKISSTTIIITSPTLIAIDYHIYVI